jgi:hypothetical protein
VVPDLARIVEQALVAVGLGLLDDLDEAEAGEALLLLPAIDLVDIGLVVLAVVEFERLGRHVRRERALVERQWGKFESHDCPLRWGLGREWSPNERDVAGVRSSCNFQFQFASYGAVP